MPLARALSVALVGVQGHLVEVEADLAAGLPALTVIGLPDAALTEARDRVRAAVVNSDESWPSRRITLGLSPATLPKSGSGFDLAMAVAVLGAAGTLPPDALPGLVLIGELGLDGRVRTVRGVLPAVLAAAEAGLERVVVPADNLDEARLVPGLRVHGVATLRGLLGLLRTGVEEQLPLRSAPAAGPPSRRDGDLSEVIGQVEARRAVEVAAAGGHHLYLHGAPGAGKTMLAERMPGLLPPLPPEDALVVSAVHSVAGALPAGCPLVTTPPYRDPHHTATVAALVGGGSGIARPGEVSLAHLGVLFLDEAPQFNAGVLDALRQPLESGEVVIARAGGAARFPARFSLVLAANPCPCAAGGDSGRRDGCTCTPVTRRRYQGRLSGPLLDRIDLQVDVRPLTRADLVLERRHVETTATVAARVQAARDRARHRLRDTPWRSNGELPGRELRGRFAPERAARRLAERHLESGTLSARGLDRVLRVAWTVADLDGAPRPGPDHVGDALFLRTRGAA